MKKNNVALEIFTHLSHLYPEDPSYVRQIELIQEHVQKQSAKNDQEIK